jgi:hypothetical protein
MENVLHFFYWRNFVAIRLSRITNPIKKGVVKMADKKDFLTTAPKQKQMTLENGSRFPNLKNIVGNSVDEHKELEEANITITGDEIRQQNENL